MKHNFEFDPTYGYDREALLRVTPPEAPEDFAAFWQATYQVTRALPLNLVRTPLPSPDPAYDLFRVDVDTWGGIRIGSWLTVPVDGDVRCRAVVGHGYGGREGPDFGLPLAHAVAIFPCAPGFNLSAHPEIPDTAQTHVVHGIASRETYILRSATAALWSAASALLALYPLVSGRLIYLGGSFGGGLGALALPWDARFARAFLRVPTFGHHPIRLRCPCVGSGEAVRGYHAAHPEVVEVLRYYDAATAAARIRVPVLVAPALFDPAVPPPGQFAVANAIPDHETFVLTAGHFEYSEAEAEDAALEAAKRRWFSNLERGHLVKSVPEDGHSEPC